MELGGCVIFSLQNRPYFSPKVVISYSSFVFSSQNMSASESFLPVSIVKSLRVFVPLFCLFILWASLTSSPGGISIRHADKVMHVGVYGLLAFATSLAWPYVSKLKIGLACLSYGGILEIAQGALSTGRVASFWDFVANGVGAVIALLFVMVINRKLTN